MSFKPTIIILFSSLAFFFIQSCSHTQSTLSPSTTLNSAIPIDTIHVASHHIETGDLLEITVYENPDLTTEVRIPEDGHIPFPLLGNIDVEGMSVLELDSVITTDLEARYIHNPLVTVVIKEYRQRNIYVTGEVKKPGGYPFEYGLTVRKAISLAGGFTEKAAKGKITVTRVVNHREISYSVDLDDEIREEDIITVARSFF